jgi:hypothetical protein
VVIIKVENEKKCCACPYPSACINYSKQVKEHCVHEAQFLSSNHRVVLLWCAQHLAFTELPVDNVNSQDFNVSFAVNLSVRNL